MHDTNNLSQKLIFDAVGLKAFLPYIDTFYEIFIYFYEQFIFFNAEIINTEIWHGSRG